MDLSTYGEVFYGDSEEDGLTMGSLWCRRRPTWANLQVHKAYPEYVWEFDRIRGDEDVRWTPYSPEDVAARAPAGLSTFCTLDSEYWLTRKVLAFDIFVEEYSPRRVMRQFGRHQAFPLTVPRVVTPSAHSYTRKGQAAGTSWWTRLEPWVVQWGQALEDVIQETRPFTSEAYEEYLRWYIPRTRTRVTHTPTIDLAQRIAVESGSVLQCMRQGIQLTGQEISLAMKRIYDTSTDIVKLNSCTSCCRHTDAVPHPSQSAPRAERPMFQHPTYTPRTAAPPPPPPPVFTTGTNYSGWRPTGNVAASSSQVPRMAPGSEMDDYDYDDEEVSGHSERYGR
ncbi:hypothetical protein EJB05_02297, partial [Eragrostis curvula]